MAISPSSPVSGSAIAAALTSPTFTLTADSGSSSRQKRWVVSALGGTQTGVVAHSISNPFDFTFTAPQSIRQLQTVDPNTGLLRVVPVNKWSQVSRKGTLPLAGQAVVDSRINTDFLIPAGVDLADPISMASLVSFNGGITTQLAAGVWDTLKTGVLG